MTIENVYTVARDAVSRLARSEKGVFIRRHWEELLHEAFVRWLEIGTELENGEQGVRRYFMKAVIRQRQKAVRRENYFAKYKKYVQDRFRPYSLFEYPDDTRPVLAELLDQVSPDDQNLLIQHYKNYARPKSFEYVSASLGKTRLKTPSGMHTRVDRLRTQLKDLRLR